MGLSCELAIQVLTLRCVHGNPSCRSSQHLSLYLQLYPAFPAWTYWLDSQNSSCISEKWGSLPGQKAQWGWGHCLWSFIVDFFLNKFACLHSRDGTEASCMHARYPPPAYTKIQWGSKTFPKVQLASAQKTPGRRSAARDSLESFASYSWF